jgi:hypothetical protein
MLSSCWLLVLHGRQRHPGTAESDVWRLRFPLPCHTAFAPDHAHIYHPEDAVRGEGAAVKNVCMASFRAV